MYNISIGKFLIFWNFPYTALKGPAPWSRPPSPTVITALGVGRGARQPRGGGGSCPLPHRWLRPWASTPLRLVCYAFASRLLRLCASAVLSALIFFCSLLFSSLHCTSGPLLCSVSASRSDFKTATFIRFCMIFIHNLHYLFPSLLISSSLFTKNNFYTMLIWCG